MNAPEVGLHTILAWTTCRGEYSTETITGHGSHSGYRIKRPLKAMMHKRIKRAYSPLLTHFWLYNPQGVQDKNHSSLLIPGLAWNTLPVLPLRPLVKHSEAQWEEFALCVADIFLIFALTLTYRASYTVTHNCLKITGLMDNISKGHRISLSPFTNA